MDLSFSAIAAGLLYGTFGVYLIRHARKKAHVPSLLIGVALVAYPYFFANPILLWGIGAVLVVIGYRQLDV